MKSKDLINWEIVSYAYDTLADIDATNLENDRNEYGRGTWASCLLCNSTYYLSSFSGTTNKSYMFTTKDIENEPWEMITMDASYHDHTIFFDDDGKRIYDLGCRSFNLS